MIVIGEKINATRSSVRAIIEERQAGRLAELAQSQAAAGATYIDVNVGTGRGGREDEIDAMRWAVAVICEAVNQPLCIDSADPAVLAAGLKALEKRPYLMYST